MQGWNINPLTGDYVMSKGAPEQSNSLLLPAYYRLKTKRQQWMYAPDLNYGSDYYTVKKRPANATNSRLEQIGANALQPIVDDGRASEITVEVTGNSRHNSEMKVTVVDAAGNLEVQTFKGLGL